MLTVSSKLNCFRPVVDLMKNLGQQYMLCKDGGLNEKLGDNNICCVKVVDLMKNLVPTIYVK